MTMLPILNLPDLPKWATNGTYVDEPPESNKLDGFKPGYKPPAKWWNWLFNLNYEWIKKIRRTALMNWAEDTALVALDVQAAIFHPEIGFWLVTLDDGTLQAMWSTDGHTWTNSNALSVAALYGFIAIDNSYYIAGNTSDNIRYSADAGQTAWSTVTSGTIGGAGTLSCICTKYPDSDFAIVSRGNSTIRIASTGITGAWAAATTDPPAAPVGPANALIYVGGSTWLLSATALMTGDSVVYRSTDDGDNWAAASPGAGPLFPSTSDGLRHMAYSEDTGRLVIVGSIDTIGNEEYIAYSDDLGDNWVAATIDKKGIPLNGPIFRVYYCGGNAWIAVNISSVPDDARGIYLSTDNAETWGMADMQGATIGGGGQMHQTACDGRRVIVFGDAGFNIHSLAI